jgi:hypothetical protein
MQVSAKLVKAANNQTATRKASKLCRTKQQDSKTARQQNSKAAKQQSSKPAKQQTSKNSNAAEHAAKYSNGHAAALKLPQANREQQT